MVSDPAVDVRPFLHGRQDGGPATGERATPFVIQVTSDGAKDPELPVWAPMAAAHMEGVPASVSCFVGVPKVVGRGGPPSVVPSSGAPTADLKIDLQIENSK